LLEEPIPFPRFFMHDLFAWKDSYARHILCFMSLLCFALALSACGSHFSKSGVLEKDVYGGRLGLSDIALSPDGHLVLVEYKDREKNQRGYALLDWRSGNLTKLPAFPVQEASFSPDGKYLIATSFDRIQKVDLATLQVTQASGDHPSGFGEYSQYEVPAVQPGSNNILYSRGYPKHLVLLNPSDRSEQIVLDGKNGFYAISKPNFIASDEVVFSAMAPHNPELNAWAKSKNIQDTGFGIYRLKFGHMPQPAFDEIYNHSAAIQNQNRLLFSTVGNISVSQDGHRVAFVDFSETDPNLQGHYNYEIYLDEDGRIKQMTNLKSHLCCMTMSADGSTIAFGSDPTRTMTHDLYVLDLRTGEIHPMLLAQRFEHSPDFN